MKFIRPCKQNLIFKNGYEINSGYNIANPITPHTYYYYYITIIVVVAVVKHNYQYYFQVV